jgi:hypothetical protein
MAFNLTPKKFGDLEWDEQDFLVDAWNEYVNRNQPKKKPKKKGIKTLKKGQVTLGGTVKDADGLRALRDATTQS